MTYLEVIDKVADRELDWEYVHKIIDEVMDDLYRIDRGFYEKAMCKLENYAYTINMDEAEKIVRSMKPFGEHWRCSEIQNYIRDNNIKDDAIPWYLTMNMVYNDFYKTASEYEVQDDTDFYFSLARDFIMDEDAEKHKVAKYFCG